MVNPETNSDTESSLERQLDHLVDTLGISYADARARLGLDAEPAVPAAPVRTRHSRRGGRSFPEPSDSELDPDWNVGPEPLSPEQQAINRRGAALVRTVGTLFELDEFRALDPKTRQEAVNTVIARHTARPEA